MKFVIRGFTLVEILIFFKLIRLSYTLLGGSVFSYYYTILF